MKQIELSLTLLLSGLVLTANTWGAISDDRLHSYQQIVERNAFGLKPIPPPPEPTPEPPQPVNIIFTGITAMSGVKKAYFKIPDAKNPNLSQFPCIQEGDRDGALEVLSIDEKEGVVKLRNAGRPMTLTFKDNGNKAQIANFAGAPGLPGVGPHVNMPIIANPNIPRGVPLPPGATMPNRTVNFPTPSAIPSPVATPGTDPSSLRTIPSRQLRTQVNPQPVAPVSAAQNEQALIQSMINVEINRELNKEKIAAGEMPPLPPTDLSDMAGGDVPQFPQFPQIPAPTPGGRR